MNSNENLKRKILKYYQNDPRIKNKINLDANALEIEDIQFEDFKIDIYNSLKLWKEKHSDKILNKHDTIDELEEIEEIEEMEELISDEEQLDLSLLGEIEEKVLSILHSINISLYIKEDLKKVLILDMLNYLLESAKNEESISKMISGIPKVFSREKFIEEIKKSSDFESVKLLVRCYPKDKISKRDRYLSKNLTREDNIKAWYLIYSISWYIENHIEHEFKEYEHKKRQIKKELIADLLTKIIPEIDEHLEKHKEKRLKKVTKRQVNNFINFFLEYLDNKYIKVDKKNKKLINEDYLFLKSKVKRYITQKYYSTFYTKI